MRLTTSGIPATYAAVIEGSVHSDTLLSGICYCNGQNWIQLDEGGICKYPDQEGWVDLFGDCDELTDTEDSDCD